MSAGEPRATEETPVRGEVATDPHAPPPDLPTPPRPSDHAPAPPTSGRGRRVAGLAGLAVLLLGAATGGAVLSQAIDDDAPEPATSNTADAAVTGREAPGDDAGSEPDEPLSRAAAAVLPSVVSITVESPQGGGEGQGSGVVIGTDGTILTNHHVVAGAGEGGLTVTLADGTTAAADVVGSDRVTDLAVIRVGAEGLTPATLGSSADLNVGDTVLAIGSPLGLDGSVTAGIVSALNRAITVGGGPLGGAGPPAVIDAIQTDAPINPGNSGGALIDTEGRVVGINTAIASLAFGVGSQGGNIGLGFAIPIDAARDIAERLIADGEVQHAYLGVRIADAQDGGAIVATVEDDSPAAAGGLERGDVVTDVEGEPIADAADLTAAVRSHQPGDTVTVTYRRDGDERTTDVTLGTLPN
ncbi:MAG TPA: trypsin-like peptidase domain-containing protein [Acidimicrobiales bacterium]